MLDRGATLDRVRDRMVQIGQQTTRRADLIGRNESETVNAELTQVYQKAAGIDRYTWRTQLDDAVREDHMDREGAVFSWDSGPSDGHPGEPVNCRCVAEPVIPAGLLDP